MPAHWRIVLLAAAALGVAVAGFLAGSARVAAIDAGAFAGPPGAPVELRGFVAAVPKRSEGKVRVRVETADGRLVVEAPEPVPDLPMGAEVRAEGVVRMPEPWLRHYLSILGVQRVVAARSVALTGRRRSGLTGLLDGVRMRAEAALERGAPAPQAALERGFVLGQDDRIATATADDFRRSGLAHLLAVSGQNVVLLAALAIPLLALLGIGLRARLLCVLALIAVYVPVAGAGPSIQRAGIMGAAGIAAALASRPRSRAYALAVAALATLLVNPRAIHDVGWQLSFAAVAGIALWTHGLASLVLRALGGRGAGRLAWRRALAEGAAMTAAATLATAPLVAHHFEGAPLASLPANLLAMPAVAPVMWIGMLVAIAGQIPAIPVEPLNWVCSLLVAYIEQVAHWFASPGWALLPVAPPGRGAVAALYGLMLGAGALLASFARRRSGLRPLSLLRGSLGWRAPPRRALLAAACAAVALALVWAPGAGTDGGSGLPAGRGLEVSFLDVGQGDAILLAPPGADPLLVDGGPPGGDLARELDAEGVGRLAAVVVTHTDLDHAGGLAELLGARPIGVLLHGDPPGALRSAAAGAGVPLRRLAQGERFRLGRLRVEVLWPPEPSSAALPPPASGERNARALVLLARWRDFSLLLTADAEAEAVPIAPGDVDVLKVAHHGSVDAGLPALLERARPELAVISVGADNPYGHPTPTTLAALEGAGVPVLRTDLDGEVEVSAGADGWTAGPEP